MDQTKAFIAEEKELTFYNARALINLEFEFVFIDDDNIENDFGFDGYVSAYFRAYDEREGQSLKLFSSQITRTSNSLIFNCSVDDMTFENLGRHFFEMGYNNSGYEVTLRFGTLNVV